jgi:hypothetical protein
MAERERGDGLLAAVRPRPRLSEVADDRPCSRRSSDGDEPPFDSTTLPSTVYHSSAPVYPTATLTPRSRAHGQLQIPSHRPDLRHTHAPDGRRDGRAYLALVRARLRPPHAQPPSMSSSVVLSSVLTLTSYFALIPIQRSARSHHTVSLGSTPPGLCPLHWLALS